MKSVFCGLLIFAVALGFVAAQPGGKKADENKVVQKKVEALPPHPLDDVFRKNTERESVNALLNNPLFKKAIVEALKAKRDQEARFRENPKLLDATPPQAARRKFLEVLQNESKAN